ncbi:RNA polymerase sigma factor [Robertkochia aurantiaca]|uniref:RNA polymerase sigma factor n=1 Tax=Robertkochia aurantiaca TaxID=2873700 RepID=UPI001CCB5F8C|nr:sigma-70 family RNA polymerase sigma factor [Robertkochia sp. 3YJGBD-33]
MNVCDKKVFEKIYKEYIQKISDFLYYKYGAAHDHFDIAQEAFVKLWQNCKKVPPEKAKSYLYTVANNTMLNALKHQKVVLKHQKAPAKNYDQEDPQFILEEQQFLKKYEKALAGLSENQRVVFLLNRIEGKSHQEIADILELSIRAVRKRLYMAVENLRKHIDGI